MQQVYPISSQSSTVSLNYDVLVGVMAFLPRRDIWSVMRTCRVLYVAGFPSLLHGVIELSTWTELASFCSFMVFDPVPRFSCLRHLALGIPGHHKTSNVGAHIVMLLQHASRLETLQFLQTGTISFDERIPRAVAALSNLRFFLTNDDCEGTFELLQNIRAPLTEIQMVFIRNISDVRVDPTLVFEPFKHSLESMGVVFVDLTTTTVQYPHLTTFSAHQCKCTRIQPLHWSFPNLTKLSLDTIVNQTDSSDADHHRQLNIEAQRRGSRWSSLKCFRGDLYSLYVLALQCKIDHIDLTSSLLGEKHHHQLHAVLSDTHPLVLQLKLRSPEFKRQQLGEVLAPVKDTLSKLALCIERRGLKYVDPSPSLVRPVILYVCVAQRMISCR